MYTLKDIVIELLLGLMTAFVLFGASSLAPRRRGLWGARKVAAPHEEVG